MTSAMAFGAYTTLSYGGEDNSFEYFSSDNAAEVWRDMVVLAPDPFKDTTV